MAQVLKGEVRERIVAAALEAFAAQGFRGASMAAIAAAAGVSTGNVYRYFADKAALFAAAVPDSFVQALERATLDRVASMAGVRAAEELPPDAAFHAVSRELYRILSTERLRGVALFAGAEGTPHAGFAERMVTTLTGLAIAHFQALDPDVEVSKAMRFGLEAIYRNLLAANLAALRRLDDPATLSEAVARIASYHLAGLRAFFEPTMPAPPGEGRTS